MQGLKTDKREWARLQVPFITHTHTHTHTRHIALSAWGKTVFYIKPQTGTHIPDGCMPGLAEVEKLPDQDCGTQCGAQYCLIFILCEQTGGMLPVFSLFVFFFDGIEFHPGNNRQNALQ